MDITTIIGAVITLLFAIIAAVLIPYIRGRTTAAQQATILMWVGIAVRAAEQIYNAAGMGEIKKKFVQAFLAKRNLKCDLVVIDAVIESEVTKLKTEQK